MEDGKVSYENAKRMKQRRQQVENTISNSSVELQEAGAYRDKMLWEIEKENRKRLNKAVYDFAEKSDRNIYDICLLFMPEYSSPKVDFGKDGVTFEQEVHLVPMPMEIAEGPGYWKSKYYRLKEKLQELIDNKED